MNALETIGETESAYQHVASLIEGSERLGRGYWMVNGLLPVANLYRLEGDWERCRAASDRALQISPLDPPHIAARVLLEHETGDIGQGEFYLAQLIEAREATPAVPTWGHGYPAMVLPLVARITGDYDYLKDARLAAETVLSSSAVSPHLAWWARVGLALIASMRGDAIAAAEQYHWLLPTSGATTRAIAVDRLLGLLSQTMGHLDDAIAHFEQALTFCRTAGYRPELAWTCQDYATTLIQCNQSEDRAAAESLLEEATAIASELGMAPLEVQLSETGVLLDSFRISAEGNPDGLSQRELEVLRLVARGKTNQEIGDELFITYRTAANHVSNILAKTGVGNRTEAATYTYRHRLV